MKFKLLVRFSAVALLLVGLASALHAQVPASPPGPGLTVVSVPLLLPPQPGVRPAAGIAHVEVKLAEGAGGAVFTQRVPPEASKVLAAVIAQIETLHPGKLKKARAEITYTGSVSAQDLAASGLGLAVALDAALGGWTPELGFMAIGTFEADGDVQPVKDAIPRLLAVMKAGAKRVIITEKQVAQVTDLMIAAGPPLFASTLFFAVNSYEDVKPIADSKLTPEMAKGMGLFAEVQKKLNAPGAKADEVLRDEDVKEALRQTMVATPTCLGARLLLRVTTGQFEKLSPEGTLFAIETMAPTIFTAVQSATPADLSKLPYAVVEAEITRMNAVRQHFDERSLPLLLAVMNYGEAVRTYTQQPAENATETAARQRTLYLTSREVIAALTKFKTPHR
ncbi:MAG: hypothetical protein QOE70_246 [Chthoniobacter sp.]|nr:hypothetical protein [Chthoniobacter sp.]